MTELSTNAISSNRTLFFVVDKESHGHSQKTDSLVFGRVIVKILNLSKNLELEAKSFSV
jgi:hypothetical protein